MKIHRAWIILISSFLTLFINYSIRIGAYAVLLPEMVKDLHLNMTQAGMIRSAYFFAYILFSPLTGWMMDRLGGRWVISVFCLFLGMGTFFMGRAHSQTEAIFFHGMVGMGAAAIWTPIVTLIQNWFGARKRGLALGILSPSYAIGFGLMGLVLPWIVQEQGWRMGWSILGIAGWSLMLVNGLLLRNDPTGVGLLPWGEIERTVPSVTRTRTVFRARDLLKERSFWLIGISYFFISFAAYMISDFIVTYGVTELKMDYSEASQLITLMALTGVAGGFLFMALSDHIGRKRSLVMIHFLLAGCILYILFARGPLSIQLGMGGFGFLYGAIWPMYGACTRDHFPREIAGTAFGMMTVFYGSGAMLNPLLAGRLTDLTGTFRWAFGTGILASVLASLVILLLRDPDQCGIEGD